MVESEHRYLTSNHVAKLFMSPSFQFYLLNIYQTSFMQETNSSLILPSPNNTFSKGHTKLISNCHILVGDICLGGASALEQVCWGLRSGQCGLTDSPELFCFFAAFPFFTSETTDVSRSGSHGNSMRVL